jgi:hypothetical protein
VGFLTCMLRVGVSGVPAWCDGWSSKGGSSSTVVGDETLLLERGGCGKDTRAGGGVWGPTHAETLLATPH